MKALRRRWEQLKAGTPGQRFQQYHARTRAGRKEPTVQRVGLTVAGVLLVVVGIVMMPAPGPGIPIVAVGGALLAGQSTLAARAMDRAELVVRRVIRWVRS